MPIQMLLTVLFGCWIPVFSVIIISIPMVVLCGVLSASCIVWLICSWRKCNRDELALCKKEYAYFWNTQFADGQEFETTDEDGVLYTVKREGLQITFPQSEGGVQVFDEVEENVRFVPWTGARLALATQRSYFMAKLALAVIEVDTIQEEDGEVRCDEPWIIPMSEQLVCAVKSFGLEDKTCENWIYLFYNPDDGMKQIYKWGYIREMRDKKTGKKIPL